MLEQEFEQLLAAYLEDELDEAGLARLTEAIQQTPARRRRFQRELRLHTLLRETATVLIEKEKNTEPVVGFAVWFGWQRIAALAACLVLGGAVCLVAWQQWGGPERIGRCVQVADADELILWRQGKQSVVRKPTWLCVGDRIQTGGEAQTTLQVNGVGTITLEGQTQVELLAPTNSPAFSVRHGRVLVNADPRAPGMPPLFIGTPKAAVQVVGTVFGLEVEVTATRLQVHEGSVRFAEISSGQSITVEAGQYCVTGEANLTALDQARLTPGALLPGQRRLLPVADACQDGNRYVNGPYLKVEGGRRVMFLKFQIPEVGNILRARLRLTQLADPGSGTLRFWEASHINWSEQSLSAATAPETLRQIGQRIGWVRLRQTVDVDVSALIQQAGTYGIMVTLEESGGNDIWFGSKESPNPPELILTCQP